jgi:ADP-ribosyl-[dinitrogen reductase] hydrolase
MPHETLIQKARGCLAGLAVGDAVGTTAEFRPKGSFRTITDMIGGGPFDLQPGEWTDDTSMALCLAESLIERDGFDARDQMERYCRWWRQGHWSATGKCFDIGNTVSAALLKFERTGEPFSGSTSPGTAGNGSIMRLAPVPIFRRARDMEPEVTIERARESSRTTHGAAECLDACEVLAGLIHGLLGGASKDEALQRLKSRPVQSPNVQRIIDGSYVGKDPADVWASGYVLQTLEAALWAFHRTTDFRSAILDAVNLGEDADTTGAVCGQIAGAFYGVEGIPTEWLEKLALREEIEAMADRLVGS